jgi:Pentapeptide repeats (8 copies)
MANDEHGEMLKKAADAWNRWRSENANVVLNLDEADLHTNLSGVNLSRANLSGAGEGWWSWAWRQWRWRRR